MFDLAEERLAWIPIKWRGLKQANPDALAEPTEFQIEVLANILDQDELQEVFPVDYGEEATEEQKARFEAASTLSKVEQVQRLVRDWRGVMLKGEPIPFTPENIAKILKLPNFSHGFELS